MHFASGAIGSIEASGNSWGRNNYISFELYGTKGAIKFSYDRRDELDVFFSSDAPDRQGFRTISTAASAPLRQRPMPIDGIGLGYGEIEDHRVL